MASPCSSFLVPRRNALGAKNEMRSISSHNSEQQILEWYVQFVPLLSRLLLISFRNYTTSAPLATLSSPMCEVHIMMARAVVRRNTKIVCSTDISTSTDATIASQSLI